MDADDQQPLTPANTGTFRTTRWSEVLAAGRSESASGVAALERLCRTYWYPIYVFVRREGHAPPDAQDLTQDFFASLLRLKSLEAVAPHKGRFRTFLLASLKHFLLNARDAAGAAKRGGGQSVISLDALEAEQRYQLEPVTEVSPEVLFDRRWRLTLLNQALAGVQAEYAAAGKAEQFKALKEFLQGPAEEGDYDRVAAVLGLNSGAVAVSVYRLRQRYRDRLRAELAQTVSNPEELADEMRYLFDR